MPAGNFPGGNFLVAFFRGGFFLGGCSSRMHERETVTEK